MVTIALFSFQPKLCPNCGEILFPPSGWGPEQDGYARQDWFAGAAHSCSGCGLHYSYAPGAAILATAAQHGDMGRYVTTGEIGQ